MKGSSKSQQYCSGISGLTLVEMIIAIAILGVLALFFSPRFIQGTQMMEHSRRSNISANIANSEMEYLRSLDLDELADMTKEDPIVIIDKDITVDGHVYDIKTIIIDHGGDGSDSYSIKVIVKTDSVIRDENIEKSLQSFVSS